MYCIFLSIPILVLNYSEIDLKTNMTELEAVHLFYAYIASRSRNVNC
jgi:hypothetical protein